MAINKNKTVVETNIKAQKKNGYTTDDLDFVEDSKTTK
jgi:hypothetical protein